MASTSSFHSARCSSSNLYVDAPTTVDGEGLPGEAMEVEESVLGTPWEATLRTFWRTFRADDVLQTQCQRWLSSFCFSYCFTLDLKLEFSSSVHSEGRMSGGDSSRLGRVIEDNKERFPHMKQYAVCQSRAFMMGCFTFLAGGAMVYLGQELLRSRLPWGRQHFLLPTIFVGTLSAYGMTRHNTRLCQQMWMAMEEKHSEITPLQERMQEMKLKEEEEKKSGKS